MDSPILENHNYMVPIRSNEMGSGNVQEESVEEESKEEHPD